MTKEQSLCDQVKYRLVDFLKAAELPLWGTELTLCPYCGGHVGICGWAAAIKPGEDIAIVSGLCAAWNGQYTPYYQPGGIIVTNPYATSWNGEYSFDGGAVLCRNDPEMLGLLPTISARCEMQVETDVTMLLALENLRIINVLRASTDRVKTAAETFLKRIKQGCTGIIIGEKPKQWSGGDETPPIEALPIAGVPANYLQQLIEMCQYIRGSTFNDLGLQANWNAKRESLNDSEINAGNDTLRPLIDNMLTCREQFCDEVNSRFGTEISVKLSGAWATREEIGEMQTESPAEQSTADGQSEEVPESETA